MHFLSLAFGLDFVFIFTFWADSLEHGSVTKYRVIGHIRNLFIRIGKIVKRNINYLSALKTDNMIMKVCSQIISVCTRHLDMKYFSVL